MLVSRTVYIFRDHFAVVIGSSLKGNIVTENQDFGHWKRLRSFRDFGGRFFFRPFWKKGRSNQTRSHQGPFLSYFEFFVCLMERSRSLFLVDGVWSILSKTRQELPSVLRMLAVVDRHSEVVDGVLGWNDEGELKDVGFGGWNTRVSYFFFYRTSQIKPTRDWVQDAFQPILICFKWFERATL